MRGPLGAAPQARPVPSVAQQPQVVRLPARPVAPPCTPPEQGHFAQPPLQHPSFPEHWMASPVPGDATGGDNVGMEAAVPMPPTTQAPFHDWQYRLQGSPHATSRLAPQRRRVGEAAEGARTRCRERLVAAPDFAASEPGMYAPPRAAQAYVPPMTGNDQPPIGSYEPTMGDLLRVIQDSRRDTIDGFARMRQHTGQTEQRVEKVSRVTERAEGATQQLQEHARSTDKRLDDLERRSATPASSTAPPIASISTRPVCSRPQAGAS